MKNENKRIDSKSSMTAAFTCMIRAYSNNHKSTYYHSDDYIAMKLLPKPLYWMIRLGLYKPIFGLFTPKGIIEYVVVRTKYIDTMYKNAIEDGIEQIVIMGAGFDTRGIRLYNQNVKVFELDTPTTQDTKLKQYDERGIDTNNNLIFIPVNFIKEDPKEKLLQNGFDKNKKSLFIFEGVLMYLNQEAVDASFTMLNKLCTKGGRVFFDVTYKEVIEKTESYYGDKSIYSRVEKHGEKWTFGMDFGKTEDYLGKYGFEIIEKMSTVDLVKRYFQRDGKPITKMNATHFIFSAEKV